MSERRNPFLGFEQIRGAAPNTKVGAGGGEIGGNVGERGLLWRSCWFVQSPVLQVSAVPISAAESIFVRAKIEIVEFQILNGQKQSFCELGIVQLVPR